MKFLMPLLALGLILTGCASPGGMAGNDRAEGAEGLSPQQVRYNTEWMQRYENVARRGGVRVYWVNLPRRPGDDTP